MNPRAWSGVVAVTVLMSLLTLGLIADSCQGPLGRSRLRKSIAMSAGVVEPASCSAAIDSPIGGLGSYAFTGVSPYWQRRAGLQLRSHPLAISSSDRCDTWIDPMSGRRRRTRE